MKSLKKLLGLMVVSTFMLGFNLNVKAEDVVFNSKEIPGLKAYDYLGDSSTSNITVRYDDKLKVSVVDITTNGLNDAAIEAILNHKAGNANSPAVFGTLYFGIDTSIEGSHFKKCSEPFNGVENMASAKNAVDSQIGSESPLTNNSVWVPQIKIDYYDNNQSKFVPLNDGGATGNRTVRDAIDDKFSDKSFSQLVYGTDYVFYGYEDRSYVGVFTSDADGYEEKYYLLVNVHTTFPVESETVEIGDKGNFNKEGYFPSLKEAMTAQNYSKNININGNVTIDEDLEVPAGVTLNAQNGSLTVKAGHTLTIKGNVKIDPQDITLEEGANIDLTTGKLENLEGDALHVVEVSTVQNGTITTNPVYAAAGDTVKIMASPNAGYKLDTESLKVTNKSTEDTIEITNNTFIMPDSDVTVSGQFIVDEDLNSLYITLVIKDEVKENYKVKSGSTLQNLLDDLKATGLNVVGFTDKEGNELNLNTNITNGMYLIAKLEDEKVEEAPKTLDSLLTFVGAGVVGLGVLGIAVKKYLID